MTVGDDPAGQVALVLRESDSRQVTEDHPDVNLGVKISRYRVKITDPPLSCGKGSAVKLSLYCTRPHSYLW